MEDKKDMQPMDNLTPENRLFMYLLTHGDAEGKKMEVVDAYHQAGYKGSKHAAYQLKSRLEKELMGMAINSGMSKADLMLQLAQLVQLPVVDKSGAPVTGVSMTHKLKTIALGLKAHEQLQEKTPTITAIQINRYSGDKKIDETRVVTTTAEISKPETEKE